MNKHHMNHISLNTQTPTVPLYIHVNKPTHVFNLSQYIHKLQLCIHIKMLNRGEPERVLQLSRENECEVLLTDCRVGVKKSESEDDPS